MYFLHHSISFFYQQISILVFTLKIEIRPSPIWRTDTRKSPTEFIAAHIYFALKVYTRKIHPWRNRRRFFTCGLHFFTCSLFMVRLSPAIYLEDSISALGFSRLFPFDIRLTNVPPFHVWHISSRNIYYCVYLCFICVFFFRFRWLGELWEAYAICSDEKLARI